MSCALALTSTHLRVVRVSNEQIYMILLYEVSALLDVLCDCGDICQDFRPCLVDFGHCTHTSCVRVLDYGRLVRLFLWIRSQELAQSAHTECTQALAKRLGHDVATMLRTQNGTRVSLRRS